MGGSDQFYKPTNMYVGSVMEFRRHRFVLIEADEYTLNYMENKKFPSSDVTVIVDKLEDDYKQVETHEGGQILHGENKFTQAANAEEEKKEEDAQNEAKQNRLNDLLG